MALKLVEKQTLREVEAEKEDECTNPTKLLENRTKVSRDEIEAVEALEELKELNQRQVTVNYDGILESYDNIRKMVIVNQEMEDELIRSAFGEKTDNGMLIKRIAETRYSSGEDDAAPPVEPAKVMKPTNQ